MEARQERYESLSLLLPTHQIIPEFLTSRVSVVIILLELQFQPSYIQELIKVDIDHENVNLWFIFILSLGLFNGTKQCHFLLRVSPRQQWRSNRVSVTHRIGWSINVFSQWQRVDMTELWFLLSHCEVRFLQNSLQLPSSCLAFHRHFFHYLWL